MIQILFLLLLAFSSSNNGNLTFGFTATARHHHHHRNNPLARAATTRNFRSATRRTTAPSSRSALSSSSSSPQSELEGEENLKALFERAVVLQRMGGRENLEEALASYERFIKAAKSTEQDPKTYAEVYINMGAIYLKEAPFKDRQLAMDCFLQAIQHRKVGTAYVNLALLTLQGASESLDLDVGTKALDGAQEFCEKALELNQDPRSVAMANKLLKDIEKMNKLVGR